MLTLSTDISAEVEVTECVGSMLTQFLDRLPAGEAAHLREHASLLQLHSGQVLFEQDQALDAIYFPVDCVASLTTMLSDGWIVEALSIGREGVVGLGLLLGVPTSPHRVVVQVAGTAWRVPGTALAQIRRTAPTFVARAGRLADSMLGGMSQSAACLARHTVPSRAARWLLTTADRVPEGEFRLTQEYLAAMLGVHRPTVTLAMQELASEGLVSYRRGVVCITDRPGLEAASCECYGVVTSMFRE
jgi:CRP-like cAMP-binding protein